MCDAGPEISGDGEAGKERESERAALHCHITSYTGAEDEKSLKEPTTSNTQLDISPFSSLCGCFTLFPVSLYLCISFSLLLGISCKLPLSPSVSVMCSLALDCSHFLFLGSHL